MFISRIPKVPAEKRSLKSGLEKKKKVTLMKCSAGFGVLGQVMVSTAPSPCISVVPGNGCPS